MDIQRNGWKGMTTGEGIAAELRLGIREWSHS